MHQLLWWLSRCVRLCVTLRTVARQAPLSTGIPQATIMEWVGQLQIGTYQEH